MFNYKYINLVTWWGFYFLLLLIPPDCCPDLPRFNTSVLTKPRKLEFHTLVPISGRDDHFLITPASFLILIFGSEPQ